MNENLSLSPAGANLIKHFEGCLQPHKGEYKSYVCPAGVRTIGWGTTSEYGHPIKADTVWSKAQCDSAFLHDMEEFEAHVRRLVTRPLKAWEYDSLTSFCYNCGPGNLAKSTLLKRVNADDPKAYEEFAKWNKGGGKVLPGLTRRRASEALLFQNIPDQNYDGKADPAPPVHPMPQMVDEPED